MSRWPDLRLNVGRLRHLDKQVGAHGARSVELVVDSTVSAIGIETSTASVPDGTPVQVVGTVTRIAGGLEFQGRIASAWTGDCRRCVEEVTGPIDAAVRALFIEDPDGAEGDDVDVYPIQGDWIDVGEVVFEELMLALPLSPLCDQACRGSDPQRFPTAVASDPGDESTGEDSVTGGSRPADPRWAALSEIEFDEQ